jgi:hypothetical protein
MMDARALLLLLLLVHGQVTLPARTVMLLQHSKQQ